MSEEHTSPEGERIRVPMTLTLRDVLLIIAAVASIVTAWGIYGTRLTVVESKALSLSNTIDEIKQTIKEIKQEDKDEHASMQKELNNLENRLRVIEEQQARLDVLVRDSRRK